MEININSFRVFFYSKFQIILLQKNYFEKFESNVLKLNIHFEIILFNRKLEIIFLYIFKKNSIFIYKLVISIFSNIFYFLLLSFSLFIFINFAKIFKSQ